MASDAILPDRRQFLAALTVTFAARRFPFDVLATSVTIKTLAEYQSEGAAYTAALSALSVNATSVSAHSALSARVGGDLTRRISRIVAEAAQDPRVVAGIKPLVASASAFDAFAKAVASDKRAVLNVPGLQAAVSDAFAREAALRRTVLSRQSSFAALLKQHATNLKDAAHLAEIAAVEKKIAEQQNAAYVMAVVAIAVAVALIVVAVVVATFSFGAGAAAAVAVTAAAVTAFTTEASKAAEAAGNAVQDCLDAAWSRRKACRAKITTPFQPQREYEQGLCELAYLADSLSCAG